MGGVFDDEGDYDGGDGGAEGEDAGDVSGGFDGFPLDDDEVGVEVGEDRHVEGHCVMLGIF